MSIGIGKKIAVGFGAVLLCFAVISEIAYRNTGWLIADTRWVSHTHAVLEALAELRLALRGAEASVTRYAITGDEGDLGAYRAMQSSLEATQNDFRRLTEDNPGHQRRADALHSLLAAYLVALDRIAAARTSANPSEAMALVRDGVGQSHLVEARSLLRLMRDEEDRLLSERNATSNRTGAQSLEIVAWGGLLGLIMCLVAGYVISRMVTKPVRDLLQGAEQFGAGNLHHRIAVHARDELGWLAEAFNRMASELGTTTVSADTERSARSRTESLLATIADTATNLVSATAEILAATTQQVAGAQQQSAAVTQTVTTVNEVVLTSEQAAERARKVSTIAQRSLSHSRTGKRVVEESVQQMALVKQRVESSAESILALAERAQAIGDIVASVRELAEQTNMLALSASIEATRAGEYGRGIGVLAREVKSLSDQSKKAATRVTDILKQIQRATGDAVMNTEECSKSVTTAVDVIAQAGESIRVLSEIIDNAALEAVQLEASATQQATGTAQIHDAMKSIDEVTVQNMSSSRQMELAAKDLNVLGSRLREKLGAAA